MGNLVGEAKIGALPLRQGFAEPRASLAYLRVVTALPSALERLAESVLKSSGGDPHRQERVTEISAVPA
jgi:hypothetical protein